MHRYTLPENILMLACDLQGNSQYGPEFAENRIAAARTIIKKSDSNVYIVGTETECDQFIRAINKGHPTTKTRPIVTEPHTDGNLLQIKTLIDTGELTGPSIVSTSGLHCMRTFVKMEKHKVQLSLIPAESIMCWDLFHTYKKLSQQHVGRAGLELLKVIEMLGLRFMKGDEAKLLFEQFHYFQGDIDRMRTIKKSERKKLFSKLVKKYGGNPLATRMAYEVRGCAATLNDSYVPNT